MTEAEFIERLTEWQPFCAALAGVSATFAGLLFVSLSVNPVLLQGKDVGADRLAQHTFGCFIYLVLTSLVLMIPRQGPMSIGLPLFGLGLLGLLSTLRSRRGAGASKAVSISRNHAMYQLSMATYATSMGVALSMINRWEQALYALVALMLWQFSWASRLAWDLLKVRD
jgi:hypothetical protein